MADIKSESRPASNRNRVAGFLLECVAGFVGIRSIDRHLEQEDQEHQLCAVPIEVPHHRTHWPIERSLSQLQGVPPLRRFRTRNSAIVDKLTRIGPPLAQTPGSLNSSSRSPRTVARNAAVAKSYPPCRRSCEPANKLRNWAYGRGQAATDNERGVRLVFYAFDLLHHDGGDMSRIPLIERRRSSRRSRPSRAFRSAAARRPTANSSSSIGNLGSSAFRQHFGLGNQVIDLVNRPRRASLALLGLSAIVDLCDCNPALIKGEGATTAYRVLNLHDARVAPLSYTLDDVEPILVLGSTWELELSW